MSSWLFIYLDFLPQRMWITRANIVSPNSRNRRSISKTECCNNPKLLFVHRSVHFISVQDDVEVFMSFKCLMRNVKTFSSFSILCNLWNLIKTQKSFYVGVCKLFLLFYLSYFPVCVLLSQVWELLRNGSHDVVRLKF